MASKHNHGRSKLYCFLKRYTHNYEHNGMIELCKMMHIMFNVDN